MSKAGADEILRSIQSEGRKFVSRSVGTTVGQEEPRGPKKGTDSIGTSLRERLA